MAQSSLPLSELLKSKDDDVGNQKLKSRDEWKKEKELEEARKAGTAPAAVDEEGRDINPHIPQYISSAPWYYASRGPTLKHQRIQPESVKEFSKPDEWYKRGVDTSKVVTKFRKGACENCGSMTHKRKDCMERPRKIGAKFTGTNIAPDEFAQPNLNLDFDGKRDRWNGYDPNEYMAVVDEYQKVEEAKRELKAEKLKTGKDGEPLPDNMVMDEENSEDEDKYVDDADMPGTKVDPKQRITVRNLRIREDVAKYLRNLDPNSAYYDPKTRSMRDNPYKNTGKEADSVDYAGENFVRFTGDTTKHAKAQLFAWEAHGKGVDVHLLAEPTKLEVLQKEYDKKKTELKGSLNQNILDRYGGEEHLDAPPKTLLMAQTEAYTEYSRLGKVIKGHEKPVIKSKYEEDVFPNNHSSIFGSYWRGGQWGYKCCHSLIKNSYCTGEAGKAGNDGISLEVTLKQKEEEEECRKAAEKEAEEQAKTLVEIHREKMLEEEKARAKKQKKNQKKKESKKRRHKKSKKEESSSSDSSTSSDSSDSEDEAEKKERKLKEALKKEEERNRVAEQLIDDRKRPYNSRYEMKTLTEEEIEAYHLTRQREEDPMLAFMEKRRKK